MVVLCHERYRVWREKLLRPARLGAEQIDAGASSISEFLEPVIRIIMIEGKPRNELVFHEHSGRNLTPI